MRTTLRGRPQARTLRVSPMRVLATSVLVVLGAALVAAFGAPRLLTSGAGRPATGDSAAAPAGPTRVRAAGVGIDAPVEAVGITARGTMDVPTTSAVAGWFAPGVRPGEPGDAVLDGYLDTRDGLPAAFHQLGRARAGELLEVDYGRQSAVTFRVDEVATYPFTSTPPGLFSRTGRSRLTLVSLIGTWDAGRYPQRLVVGAALAG